MQKLYYPDRALDFRHLHEEMLLVLQMRPIFDRLAYETEEDAMYDAYVQTHSATNGVTDRSGSKEFDTQLRRHIEDAILLVEGVIRDRFNPLRLRIPMHRDVMNCLSPRKLLEYATTPVPAGAGELNRRLRFEALRNLAIALQLYAIERADNRKWVFEDLDLVAQLSKNRLFVPESDVRIWHLSQVLNKGPVVQRVRIAHTRRDLQAHRKYFDPKKGPLAEDFIQCRVVRIKRRVFYVFVADPRKRTPSTLLKLERERGIKDRRRWMYILVGVHYRMKLRAATIEDAHELDRYVRQHLWQEPLHQHSDDGEPNPDSHPNYQALQGLKAVGRIHRPDGRRVIAAQAEQVITTLVNHLATVHSRNRMNHALYTNEKYLKYLARLWFPQTRADLGDLPDDIHLPGYNVLWDSDSVQKMLHTWWLSQL